MMNRIIKAKSDLHLPDVIAVESAGGDTRYLLSDGLGSPQSGQVSDDNGEVVAYNEYDSYGNPTDNGPLITDYGFTGEWWENEVGLLHLRARWYLPYVSRPQRRLNNPLVAFSRSNQGLKTQPLIDHVGVGFGGRAEADGGDSGYPGAVGRIGAEAIGPDLGSQPR
jgi:hypothetical protein